MNEETTTIEKPTASGSPTKVITHQQNDSQFGGITIRAWLALMVIGTLCAIELSMFVHSMVVKDYNWTPQGEFWMVVTAIITHYYKNEKSTNDPKQPEKTTSTVINT